MKIPSTGTIIEKLKPPSIDALKELFEAPEEELPSIVQEPEIKVLVPEIPPTEIKEEKLDFSRLFQEHKLDQEETIPSSPILSPPLIESIDTEELYTDSMSPVEQSEEFIQVNVRSEVCKRLQKAGWAVRMNFENRVRKSAEPDVIAEKGLIRKHKRLIFFAENPTDAEICSFLLQSSLESGEKIVYLLNGNPKDVSIPLEIKLMTQIDQLFK